LKKKILNASIALALSMPMAVFAADSAEMAELKRMILEMKQQHEQKIQQLENRVQQAETRAKAAEKKVETTETKVAAVEEQVQTRSSSADNSFNPAISLVLQGGIATYSENPEDYHLEGMPLGGEAGLPEEGLALWETELTASANIDNLFFGQATIGLHTHEGEIEVDVEEAFIDTLSLPAGLGVRFGRFYSALGYLNEHHTHAWDFADAPLAYNAFLGGQYRDDGIRASWVAPTDTVFLELGAEAMRGDAYPGGGNDPDFGAVQNVFAKMGGDVGRDSSWQVGLAHMNVDVVERSAGGHGHDHGDEGAAPSFTGDSDLTVLDAVWKTSLGGERAIIVQGEYLWRDENGQVTFTEDADQALFNYDGEQDGWYLQGIYQFNRQWRTGLRYDHLSASNNLAMVNADLDGDLNALDQDEVFEESGFETSSHDPNRWSAMIDWSPSEFSRLRFQYSRDESRGVADDQVFLQYITTLGAHGAHRY